MKLKADPSTSPPGLELELRVIPLRSSSSLSPSTPPMAVTRHELKHLTHSPGGAEARRQGCSCPTLHDERGSVVFLVDGHPMMVIRKGCPVHTPLDTSEPSAKGDKGAFIRTYGAVRKVAALTKEEEEKPHGGPK